MASLEDGRAEAQNLRQVMSQHMAQVLDATDRTLTLAKLFHERKVVSLPFERAREGDEADARAPRPSVASTCSMPTAGS